VGAGKTTIAAELIALLAGPTVYIEGDTLWSFIATREVRKPSPKNFKMIKTSMVAAAVPCALYGYEALVDFSIPPWFLETARDLARMRNVPLHYVVLRPSEKVCAARAAGRKRGAVADYARYHELYADFNNAARFTIQDDENDVKTVAARIREGLEAGTFLVMRRWAECHPQALRLSRQQSCLSSRGGRGR
jgi:gluconate kinase